MTFLRSAGSGRFWSIAVCATALVTSLACGWPSATPAPPPGAGHALPGQVTGVFTPAHRSVRSAVDAFFWRQPEPVQPVEFPHNTHSEQGLLCLDCHQTVETGPIAGFPTVNTCMACHASTAVDKPRIQAITALQEKGLDVAWQRVYRYTNQQHVRFDHAPHVAAKVGCSTCHGDVAKGTVATRNVDLTMGFCVSCHRQQGAPNECLTCHY